MIEYGVNPDTAYQMASEYGEYGDPHLFTRETNQFYDEVFANDYAVQNLKEEQGMFIIGNNMYNFDEKINQYLRLAIKKQLPQASLKFKAFVNLEELVSDITMLYNKRIPLNVSFALSEGEVDLNNIIANIGDTSIISYDNAGYLSILSVGESTLSFTYDKGGTKEITTPEVKFKVAMPYYPRYLRFTHHCDVFGTQDFIIPRPRLILQRQVFTYQQLEIANKGSEPTKYRIYYASVDKNGISQSGGYFDLGQSFSAEMAKKLQSKLVSVLTQNPPEEVDISAIIEEVQTQAAQEVIESNIVSSVESGKTSQNAEISADSSENTQEASQTV